MDLALLNHEPRKLLFITAHSVQTLIPQLPPSLARHAIYFLHPRFPKQTSTWRSNPGVLRLRGAVDKKYIKKSLWFLSLQVQAHGGGEGQGDA